MNKIKSSNTIGVLAILVVITLVAVLFRMSIWISRNGMPNSPSPTPKPERHAVTTETPELLVQEAIENLVTTQPNLVLNAPFMSSMSGSVDQLGGTHTIIFPGDNARDNADFEGFITFDISGVSHSDTILDARMSFGTCVTSGFPFSDPPFGLGPLSVDVSEYGDLDVGDYLGAEGDTFAFELLNCPDEPINVIHVLLLFAQADLFQIRLYFSGSNGDFYRDDVTITDPQLVIEYIAGD